MSVRIWKLLEGSTQSSPTPSLGSSGLVFGQVLVVAQTHSLPWQLMGKRGSPKPLIPDFIHATGLNSTAPHEPQQRCSPEPLKPLAQGHGRAQPSHFSHCHASSSQIQLSRGGKRLLNPKYNNKHITVLPTEVGAARGFLRMTPMPNEPLLVLLISSYGEQRKIPFFCYFYHSVLGQFLHP